MNRRWKKAAALIPAWILFGIGALMGTSASADVNSGLNVEVYTIDTMGGAYDAKPLPSWKLCASGWTYAPNIQANWGGGSVADCRGDFVAVHYSGWIHYTGPEGGTTVARFDNISDDGFTLDIEGQRVINDWNLHGCTGRSGWFIFENNIWYPLDAWFFEWGGGACNTLYWTVDNNRAVVPPSAYSAYKIEPNIDCWDGSKVYNLSECPVEPQVPCWNGTIVHYENECPVQPYLNAPKNVRVEVKNGNVYLKWDAPDPSDTTTVEHYAVMFSTSTVNGWGISISDLEVLLDKSIFESTGGLDQMYTFMIRADNDTSGVYSPYSDAIQAFVDAPHVTCWNGDVVYEQSLCAPEPKPEVECWDGSMVFTADDCPVKPTPTPTPTKPTETPTPTPTEETPTPSPTLEPTPSPTDVEPSESPSPGPTTVGPSPSVEPSPITLPTIPAPLPSPDVTDPAPDPTPSDVIDDTSIPEDAQQAIDQANADGVLTEEEKQQVADALVESYANAESIPFDVLQESGIDYEDLPPDQPISLENGVVLTAAVADALQIFEAPAEILTAVFKNPAKMFKAISNVGADMRPEVRDKAQKVVVSAIIVVQVIGSVATIMIRK